MAVIAGLKVPLALRERQDGRYEVVGETYVHGVMKGEAFNEAKSSQIILV